ncbi:hypothetical protein GCM10012284_53330 [Mangrovihabitans endophyticus]|uniref:S-adenosyl methyltransferase n=1 Tax=Mangrovihabitans endophyticus TaxID=1751298 RepID=A0A8J3FRT4_9ACTN|nr:hypothetical protein GCM10012284_53330 [Mangrovihabitans endophyticus]
MLDTRSVASARRYNYWLGGKDNFAADRASGDRLAVLIPGLRAAAAANRAFVHRATAWLAATTGISQYLDLGCGLPVHTDDLTVHRIAVQHGPHARTVYVDHDPMVAVHARAWWTHPDRQQCRYVHADLRDPDRLLADPDLTALIDLTRPTIVLACAVLHYLPDHHAYPALDHLIDRLAPGSHLAITHATLDFLAPYTADLVRAQPAAEHGPCHPRTRPDIHRFLTGLHPAEPGLVPTAQWRPDNPAAEPGPSHAYAAVAAKP